jgi:hypothetical protein
MQSDGIRLDEKPAFPLDIGRHLPIAMQKVVGSSPISRFRETRTTTALLAFRRDRPVSRSPSSPPLRTHFDCYRERQS